MGAAVRYRPCPKHPNHKRFGNRIAQTLTASKPHHPIIKPNAWICHGCSGYHN